MLICAANDLAVALAHWGQVEEARRFHNLAQQELGSLNDHVAARGWLLLSAAELALAERQPHDAAEQARAALDLLQRGSPEGLAQAHRVAALAWNALGNRERAATHWQASLATALRQGQLFEEARTRQAMNI